VHVSRHKDRLGGIWPDRRTVGFTSALVAFEIPACHDEFTLTVDDELTCLWSMDDYWLAFSETAIYVLVGDGPSDRYPGADSDYRGFRRIASDVGCIDPESLCTTPDGTLFRSRNGLCVLTRGLQVVPFGLEMRTTLDANIVRTSAVYHPTCRWLYVACDNGATGVCLVYDFIHKAWSYDTRALGQAADRMHALCVFDGAVHFVAGSDGEVWKEGTGTYLDGSTFVAKSVQLAHFKSSGPVGNQVFQQFALLGERHTAHGMTLTATYDYGTSRTDSQTFTDTEVSAHVNSPIVQLLKSFDIHKCESVSITLTDVAPTVGVPGNGRGATWIAYGYEHEKKPQPFPLPAAQQR
jgi:hypothetical protein